MANNQATGNNMQPLNKYTEQFYASSAKKKNNKENNYLYGFCFICGTLWFYKPMGALGVITKLAR